MGSSPKLRISESGVSQVSSGAAFTTLCAQIYHTVQMGKLEHQAVLTAQQLSPGTSSAGVWGCLPLLYWCGGLALGVAFWRVMLQLCLSSPPKRKLFLNILGLNASSALHSCGTLSNIHHTLVLQFSHSLIVSGCA